MPPTRHSLCHIAHPECGEAATSQGELLENYKSTTTNTSTQQIYTVLVSVSDFPALQKFAHKIFPNQTKTEHTILFNCAGIPSTTKLEKIPMDQYNKLVQTNQLGAIFVLTVK
jgi:NADP-dependent 3-hydroxy acid dehydrogenase YdfG